MGVALKLIELKGHTVELQRLCETGAPDERVNAEFDRVCMTLFRATLGDILQRDWERLNTSDLNGSWSSAAGEYCRQHGYDLLLSSDHPVCLWEYFAMMVRAKVRGMLPQSPEDRALRRLAADARKSKANKGSTRG
jgi:hypothetical protein